MRGLVIEDIYRYPDSSMASIGLLWVSRQSVDVQTRFVELVFERYWRQALDLAEVDALTAVMTEVGADLSGWSDYLLGQGPRALEALRSELGSAQLFHVPSYVVEDEIFIGREHLPMIRWLLTDRQGQPPI